MGFFYGLAVLLVIFEGIIIQCDGAPKPYLPGEIIEVILSKTDFQTIKGAVREFLVPPNDIVMSRILRDDLVQICPNLHQLIDEYQYKDDIILKFGSYDALTSFFDKFGDKVKRLRVEVYSGISDESHNRIIQNIIKKNARNLEELQISIFNDMPFWEELLDGQNYIIFPEVKKLQFWGPGIRTVLKLNLMFPKLESLNVNGNVADKNCLANVKGLKELILNTDSIQEQQLDGIFANNKNMTMISLTKPNRTETIHSISKHLTKLRTLEVISPGEDFMIRTNDGPVYTLPSVNRLIIKCYETREVFGNGNFSINMPNLKELILKANSSNKQIVEFIEQFTELETLELSVNDNDAIECLRKFKHIKEFTTSSYRKKFPELKFFFETFDGDSKLQRVIFLHFGKTTFKYYEKDMEEFNNKLKALGKPTWTLTKGAQGWRGLTYAMFERNPSK